MSRRKYRHDRGKYRQRSRKSIYRTREWKKEILKTLTCRKKTNSFSILITFSNMQMYMFWNADIIFSSFKRGSTLVTRWRMQSGACRVNSTKSSIHTTDRLTVRFQHRPSLQIIFGKKSKYFTSSNSMNLINNNIHRRIIIKLFK